MKRSLCGHHPCPGICSRVCHCPAGLARVRWLYLLRRGYRGGSETRASPQSLFPRERWHEVEFSPQKKHPYYALNAPESLTVPHTCPTHNWEISKGANFSPFYYNIPFPKSTKHAPHPLWGIFLIVINPMCWLTGGLLILFFGIAYLIKNEKQRKNQ